MVGGWGGRRIRQRRRRRWGAIADFFEGKTMHFMVMGHVADVPEPDAVLGGVFFLRCMYFPGAYFRKEK